MSRKKIDPMVQYAQEQEQQKMENIQQQFFFYETQRYRAF